MSVAALLLAILGFALLGLATDAHHERRFGRRPSRGAKRRMRISAWTALFGAFPFAIIAEGPILGPILWAGLVMLSAGSVFLALNIAPARLSRFSPFAETDR
jgi:hypothetical protein